MGRLAPATKPWSPSRLIMLIRPLKRSWNELEFLRDNFSFFGFLMSLVTPFFYEDSSAICWALRDMWLWESVDSNSSGPLGDNVFFWPDYLVGMKWTTELSKDGFYKFGVAWQFYYDTAPPSSSLRFLRAGENNYGCSTILFLASDTMFYILVLTFGTVCYLVGPLLVLLRLVLLFELTLASWAYYLRETRFTPVRSYIYTNQLIRKNFNTHILDEQNQVLLSNN